MNLQPVPIEDIPLGRPLPWRLHDHNGYIVFMRGEMVASREQLENLLVEGLLRDIDAPQRTHETGNWVEFKETALLHKIKDAGGQWDRELKTMAPPPYRSPHSRPCRQSGKTWLAVEIPCIHL